MLDQTYSSSFEVQQVVDQKLIDGETHFLVKWVGYDHSENTWEPLRHMTHSKDKIKEWQQFKINQLNLTAHKKLHEQLNIGPEKNRPKTNLQTLKNVSNPYKKVYLRIDEEDQFKLKEPEQGKTKIQTIFDQPEMKKIIKIKKSDRKKKELQLFEKRLKTRPKIWEKYLQNEDQVIKRANQKIKQVIDKAYGGNQKNKDVGHQKEIVQRSNQTQVKKKVEKNYFGNFTQKSPIFNLSNNKTQRDNFKTFQPIQKQYLQTNKIIEKELISKQKDLSNYQTKQQKPSKKQAKQKLNIRAKNLFFSTQEESQQIFDHMSKRKQLKIQKNHKTQKNVFNNKLLIHSDSSIEQETNFISLKDKKGDDNKAIVNKKIFAEKIKHQKTLLQNKETFEGNLNNQRKTWVKDLVKGIVLENKKKESIEIKNQLGQQRKIFTIKPQTIMVTQVMRRKLKGENMKQIQMKHEKRDKIQMSKISEQSQRNSYFSKISSVSNNVQQGMFRLNKPSYAEQKSVQIQTKNSNSKIFIVEQEQKDNVKKCSGESIQVQSKDQSDQKCNNIEFASQNVLSNNQSLDKCLPIACSIPFQCSISSVDQSLNKNCQNNSFIEQNPFKFLIKPQETVKNRHEQNDKSSQKQGQRLSPSQQQNVQCQNIQDQEQSLERVINYSTLTNHISTAATQSSSESHTINRNEFLNLIRQQSMSTRASQRIQQHIHNNQIDSRSLPIQSIDLQLNQTQNQSSHEQFIIPQNSHKSINNSQQLSLQLKEKKFQHKKTNNNLQSQKSYQHSHLSNLKQIHPQENIFFSLNFQKELHFQTNKHQQEKRKQSFAQDQIIDYFLFEQKNHEKINSFQNEKKQQIYLQVSKMNKESITKKDEPKLPSFVKEISTNCINNLNNSLSNRDKESLILKYDFSSIN